MLQIDMHFSEHVQIYRSDTIALKNFRQTLKHTHTRTQIPTLSVFNFFIVAVCLFDFHPVRIELKINDNRINSMKLYMPNNS